MFPFHFLIPLDLTALMLLQFRITGRLMVHLSFNQLHLPYCLSIGLCHILDGWQLTSCACPGVSVSGIDRARTDPGGSLHVSVAGTTMEEFV